MNDKNPDSASYLLDTEVREDLRIALEMGSEQDFGMSWIPLSSSELHYRVYREEGQLYVCVGKVGSDDTVETYGTNVVNDDRLEAVESELEKLLQQFC